MYCILEQVGPGSSGFVYLPLGHDCLLKAGTLALLTLVYLLWPESEVIEGVWTDQNPGNFCR